MGSAERGSRLKIWRRATTWSRRVAFSRHGECTAMGARLSRGGPGNTVGSTEGGAEERAAARRVTVTVLGTRHSQAFGRVALLLPSWLWNTCRRSLETPTPTRSPPPVLHLSLPMASTFFTWLRSPAAREYFFSESFSPRLFLSSHHLTSFPQALTFGAQFVASALSPFLSPIFYSSPGSKLGSPPRCHCGPEQG